MKTFVQTLFERNLISQTSTGVREAMEMKDIIAYIGFDLTAPALHVGSLIQLMALRWLSKTGNTPIVLLGEATTRIGDPSDKDESRPILPLETIEKNRLGIKAIIEKIVPGAQFVSNADWFSNDEPSFMEFLTKFGRHFTINRMMTFDSVKRRLDRQQPLTFLEFCYMLLQAVDFKELHERVGVNMQIGGSDQWGNIVNGIELTRRMCGDQVVGVTTPLFLDSQGNKMGKSSGKPIWLDPAMTTPFEFFQFWRNIDDAMVNDCLLMFTEWPLDVIEDVRTWDVNEKKKRLAWEVTRIVHGTRVADKALDDAEKIFRDGNLDVAESTSLPKGTTLVDAITQLGFAPSRNEARRLISQNAVSLNGDKIVSDCPLEDTVVIRVGKKKSARVETI